MSATAQVPAGAPPPGRTKKKLIIIVAALLLIVLATGGGAVYLMKKRAAEDHAEESGGEKRARKGPLVAPIFVALDPFVVNLADKDTDRFAQIGLTLEVDNEKFAEEMKSFMPAIRNAILMVLTSKTSQELLARSGKEALASEITRAVVRPMGIEIREKTTVPKEDLEAEFDPIDTETSDDDAAKSQHAGNDNPVKRVHFSSFIIQ